MVRFLLLRMALAPMKILRRGLQFQVMMKNLNQYLIGMYEAVVHRILGCYVGLRRDPKFLQAFDVVQLSESWAPARIPEAEVRNLVNCLGALSLRVQQGYFSCCASQAQCLRLWAWTSHQC